MLADDPSGVRAYQGHPLPGSPASRLQEDAARRLRAGTVRRCPHPDQPAFWCLDAGLLTCLPCTREYLQAAREPSACQVCGGPASAMAAWVAGDVPCLAALCEPCRRAGLVLLTLN